MNEHLTNPNPTDSQGVEGGAANDDAPVGRIGAPFAPVPFSPALEEHYVPNAGWITAEVLRMLGRDT